MTTTAPREQTAYSGAYDLSEDQDLFRQTVHEFAVREIVPIAVNGSLVAADQVIVPVQTEYDVPGRIAVRSNIFRSGRNEDV